MTQRPDPAPDRPGPADLADAPDAARRALLRGAALLGLAGVTGLSLSACGGGGSEVTTAAGPPADPVAEAPPARLPTKSEVHRRTPEPRVPRAPAPAEVVERAPEAPPPRAADLKAPAAERKAAGGEPAASKSGGSQPSARAPREPAAKAPAEPKPAKPARTARPTATSAPVVAETIAGAKTADIPVGGGRIYTKEKIVVTQPTAGDFKGFSAVCTHQSCLVSQIDAGEIVCVCHGSRFGIADGAVLRGPAFLALPEAPVAVHGDQIHPA